MNQEVRNEDRRYRRRWLDRLEDRRHSAPGRPRGRRRLAQYRSSYKKGERSMAGTTQDVLTEHLACFGKCDLDGIMADLHARVEAVHPEQCIAWDECDPGALRDDRLGILEAG